MFIVGSVYKYRFRSGDRLQTFSLGAAIDDVAKRQPVFAVRRECYQCVEVNYQNRISASQVTRQDSSAGSFRIFGSSPDKSVPAFVSRTQIGNNTTQTICIGNPARRPCYSESCLVLNRADECTTHVHSSIK